MVLTNNQTTFFFEDQAQGMALLNAVRVALQGEGIDTVDDVGELDKDQVEAMASNLRRQAPPIIVTSKSQKRLIDAAQMLKYYAIVSRPVSAGAIRWAVVKSFTEQWKALVTKKKDDIPDTPKISKALPIMRWIEAFEDFLRQVIGIRMVPLFYVVRPNEAVPAVVPPLVQHAGTTIHPHSDEYGSVEIEMTFRASHNHPLYRDDNQKVYFYVEEATRGTMYQATIKPFTRTRDGRGSFNALKAQFAGKEKWDAEIKKCEDIMFRRIWKGQSNYKLESFVAQHRNAFAMMQEATRHTTHQLPDGYTRVGYVLDHIECSDSDLKAVVARIRADTTDPGPRNDFEQMAAELVPADPVAKKLQQKKRGNAEISAVGSSDDVEVVGDAEVSALLKAGRGPKTGVHLRYYKKQEYKTLTDDQKAELREWRLENGLSVQRVGMNTMASIHCD